MPLRYIQTSTTTLDTTLLRAQSSNLRPPATKASKFANLVCWKTHFGTFSPKPHTYNTPQISKLPRSSAPEASKYANLD